MRNFLWLSFLVSRLVCSGAGYMVVVSKNTSEDPKWAKVVSALREKHDAGIFSYEDSVEQSLPVLKSVFPRYACFVATPEETTKGFVRSIHCLTRKLDDDPYTDLFWGILSDVEVLSNGRQRL